MFPMTAGLNIVSFIEGIGCAEKHTETNTNNFIEKKTTLTQDVTFNIVFC